MVSPLKKALDGFINKTQEVVTGSVKLKLYKGNIAFAGAKSDYSLFDEDLATFEKDEVYNQKDATGFINISSISLAKSAAVINKNKK